MRAEVPIVKLSANRWNNCVDHASGVKGAARGQADLRGNENDAIVKCDHLRAERFSVVETISREKEMVAVIISLR